MEATIGEVVKSRSLMSMAGDGWKYDRALVTDKDCFINDNGEQIIILTVVCEKTPRVREQIFEESVFFIERR